MIHEQIGCIYHPTLLVLFEQREVFRPVLKNSLQSIAKISCNWLNILSLRRGTVWILGLNTITRCIVLDHLVRVMLGSIEGAVY